MIVVDLLSGTVHRRKREERERGLLFLSLLSAAAFHTLVLFASPTMQCTAVPYNLPCDISIFIRMAEEVDYDSGSGDEAPAYDASEQMDVGFSTKRGSTSRSSGKSKVKGRGHGSAHMYGGEERYEGRGGVFERIGRSSGRGGPLQCKNLSKYLILTFFSSFSHQKFLTFAIC